MDALLNEKIGARIRTVRQSKKLTQEKLAEEADLSPSYISRVENGDSAASLDSLYHIALAMNVGIEVLICDLFLTSPKNETIKEINITASALTPQKQKIALHYLQYLSSSDLDLNE